MTRHNSLVSVPAIPRGVLGDRTCQFILVIRLYWLIPLREARLADHLAHTPLGDCKDFPHMLHAQAATGRAKSSPLAPP